MLCLPSKCIVTDTELNQKLGVNHNGAPVDQQVSATGVGWLFGPNGPLRQYFSLYGAVSQRGERKEK